MLRLTNSLQVFTGLELLGKPEDGASHLTPTIEIHYWHKNATFRFSNTLF